MLALPGVERLPLATYQKIEEYAQHGGIVIATRRLPSTAPGLMNAANERQEIQAISRRLFRDKGAPGHFIEDEEQLGSGAATLLVPDVTFSPKASEVGFIHRRLGLGDLYFIANTGNQTLTVQAKFRQSAKYAAWLDPFTGRVTPVEDAAKIDVSLLPYESRLIVFTNSAMNPKTEWTLDSRPKIIDLSTDWNVTFGEQSIHMDSLHSWSDEERSKYFSGQATYERVIDLPAENLSGTSVVLDFGEGTPVARPDPLPEFNLRSFLDGPVREAAEVYVNGKRAGVVWHPPYTLDVTTLLKPGKNELRIVVGNTAINELSGCALADYRLLNDRYGERFVPQGMENLQPLPSGLTGGVKLKVTPRHEKRSHPSQ
jgi:hypothetical protein